MLKILSLSLEKSPVLLIRHLDQIFRTPSTSKDPKNAFIYTTSWPSQGSPPGQFLSFAFELGC